MEPGHIFYYFTFYFYDIAGETVGSFYHQNKNVVKNIFVEAMIVQRLNSTQMKCGFCHVFGDVLFIVIMTLISHYNLKVNYLFLPYCTLQVL
jgi:hypothetical protein